MTLTTRIAAVAVLGALQWACNSSEKSTGTGGSQGQGADAAKATLSFSAIPDQQSTELAEKFGLLAKYLSDKLEVPVEYVPATNYAASVEMFTNGDVQLAWFGGLTGVQARANVEGAEAIAQGKSDPQYYSYFVAHADTGLERSDDFPAGIKDLKFTFGSESSTSGRLMPSFFIIENTGQNPDDWFSKPVAYSGSHDKTALQVASGQFEAGVLNYKVYEKLVAAFKEDPSKGIDPEKCKIIWKTPYYADYNFTAHPKLEETYGAGFIKKLQEALLAIDDPAILDAFPREAIIAAKNEDFDGIVKVAKDLGFLR